ncbi:MAG: response regulator [Sutterella wadsworthensis]
MRNSWAFLIEGEGWDVKTYADAITFLSSNDYIRPGCLLLDVRMPHMSGLELQLKLRKQAATCRSSSFRPRRHRHGRQHPEGGRHRLPSEARRRPAPPQDH